MQPLDSRSCRVLITQIVLGWRHSSGNSRRSLFPSILLGSYTPHSKWNILIPLKKELHAVTATNMMLEMAQAGRAKINTSDKRRTDTFTSALAQVPCTTEPFISGAVVPGLSNTAKIMGKVAANLSSHLGSCARYFF